MPVPLACIKRMYRFMMLLVLSVLPRYLIGFSIKCLYVVLVKIYNVLFVVSGR